MLYHIVASRLPTFKARLQEGGCIEHVRGGVYEVLTSNDVLRTTHVRAIEDEFPGMRRIRQNEDSDDSELSEQACYSDASHSSSTVYVQSSSDLESDDDNDDHYDGHESPAKDLVTYVPIQPSTFGNSNNEADESSNEESDGEDDVEPDSGGDGDDEFVDALDEDDDDALLSDPISSRIRRQPRVHNSAAAIPKAISTEDELKLSQALKSPE